MATKSYVITVDSIPPGGLGHRRRLTADVIHPGADTSSGGAHRADRRATAKRDYVSYGGGRHPATPAEARRRRAARIRGPRSAYAGRRRAARDRRPPHAVVLRSC